MEHITLVLFFFWTVWHLITFIFIPRSLQRVRSSCKRCCVQSTRLPPEPLDGEEALHRASRTFSSGTNHKGSRSPSPLYLHLISWVKLALLNFLINHPLLPLSSSVLTATTSPSVTGNYKCKEQTDHHGSCHVECQKRYTALHTGTATPLCHQPLVL